MDSFDARRAALDLVTAFVNNNSLKAQELPALLSDVYAAIAGFESGKADDDSSPDVGAVTADAAVAETETLPDASDEDVVPKAAVSIGESLQDPDYILSMITGEKLKTLKRHLRHHGLDEQQYRERYNLPDDYPMVAPAYSAFRRNVATKMGLGRAGKDVPPKATAPAPTTELAGVSPIKTKKPNSAAAKASSAIKDTASPPSSSTSAPVVSARKRSAKASAGSEGAASSAPVAKAAVQAKSALARKAGKAAGAVKGKAPKSTRTPSAAAVDIDAASGDAALDGSKTMEASAPPASKARRRQLKPVFND
ncbi:MAG: MucR family transcriptional regulator [Sphingomonas sp.]|nr:MucR family transcriptional regulator [Sphingomonas sp.]